MKHLNKKQWLAVIASLVVVGYWTFSGSVLALFSGQYGVSQMENNNIQSNLAVEDILVGNGEIVNTGDTITVHYVGTLTDGKVFDSSRDRNVPLTFTLGAGSVIKGWDEGLLGMRVGGTRRLTIGPEYGYGNYAVGAIPANSTLIFEVELLNAAQGN